jgi:hypothetical protein
LNLLFQASKKLNGFEALCCKKAQPNPTDRFSARAQQARFGAVRLCRAARFNHEIRSTPV